MALTDAELRAQLDRAWPMMTWRDIGDIPRTVVVLHSVAVYLPPSWQPLLPAYEERFLCYVLGLVSRGTHVVYVTSMPILPRLIDYWFALAPGLDTPEARARLTLVPVVDARPIPLTRKVLEHPSVVERIRRAVRDPTWAVTMGHTVTEDDRELARRLGVPSYGPAPSTARWGTKSGSREVFRRAGIATAPGVEGVRTRADVDAAIAQLRSDDLAVVRVIVKHDQGVSGIGNGTITVPEDRRAAAGTVGLADLIELEEPSLTAEDYYARLEVESGVVEAFLQADEVTSPSVQMRISPAGEAEVLATHEQVLSGRNGLTFEGCSMPARPEYARALADAGTAAAQVLAAEGVMGRFSLDFLACRTGTTWTVYGLEINLRNGGTTHTLTTLTSLCGGSYAVASGSYLADDGSAKCYRATDHLHSADYARLTTDDVLDLLDARGLGWDPSSRTGIVVHMASAIAGMGTIGVTAIADDPQAARSLFESFRAALDDAAEAAGP